MMSVLMMSSAFMEMYIGILPGAWTVISVKCVAWDHLYPKLPTTSLSIAWFSGNILGLIHAIGWFVWHVCVATI